MKRRNTLLVLLSICILAATVFFCVSAESVSAQGTCGENLTWVLADNTLTISGTGDMTDYLSTSHAPWFNYRSSVQKLVIGEGVTSIGDYAFRACSMPAVIIPDSVTSIGDYAFRTCTSLQDVYVGAGVKTIGQYAFWSSELTRVTLPAGLESVGDSAFYQTYLEHVYYLGTETQWESISFGANNVLSNISRTTDGTVVDDQQNSQKYWALVGDTLTVYKTFPEFTNAAWKNYIPLIRHVVVEKGNTQIPAGLFADYPNLETATLAQGVYRIGSGAFSGCAKLYSVQMGLNVEKVEASAFEGCTSLTSIGLQDVTAIAENTFRNSGLKKIQFSGNVTSIGANAFQGCELEDVYFLGTQAQWDALAVGDGNTALRQATLHLGCDHSWDSGRPILENVVLYTCSVCAAMRVDGSCGENAFWELDGDTLVISGSGDMYDFDTGAKPWGIVGTRISRVVIRDGITSVGNRAFSGMYLQSVDLGNTVTRIGEYAFYNVDSLVTVHIGKGLTTLGNFAFSECYSLTGIFVDTDNPNYSSDSRGVLFNKDKTILVAAPIMLGEEYTIPETVTQIAPYAFDRNSTLKTVVLGDHIKSLGEHCFSYCSTINEVIIGDGVEIIPQKAFFACFNLERVVMGKNVQTIETEAFNRAEALAYISFEDKLTQIDAYAFYSCDSLADVYYNGTLSQWEQITVSANNTDLTDATLHYYVVADSLADAVAAYSDPASRILLQKDTQEDLVLSKDVYLDLNGYDLTGSISGTGTLYVMDSQTDDFTVMDGKGYGTVSGELTANIAGVPADASCALDGYLMVESSGSLSFHRVSLQIKSMVLRPTEVGIYFKSDFAGDEMVEDHIASFGIAFSLTGAPDETTLANPKQFSRYSAEAFNTGAEMTGTLLTGILKETNGYNTNMRNGQLPIYGRAYVQTVDGEYFFGQTRSRSFREQLEGLQRLSTDLTDAQFAAVSALCRRFESVMRNWKVSSFLR